MRRGGAKKRRDANEPELIKAARRVGAEAWQVSGAGLPDVILKFRGQFFCGEIKTIRGTLTKQQGAFPVWRTAEDVLRAIGAIS